jgi:hypothetical protein
MAISRTRFSRKAGKVQLHSMNAFSMSGRIQARKPETHSIGVNQIVSDKLPKLPPRNVKASD